MKKTKIATKLFNTRTLYFWIFREPRMSKKRPRMICRAPDSRIIKFHLVKIRYLSKFKPEGQEIGRHRKKANGIKDGCHQ